MNLQEHERPSFYAIIPAHVRYCKSIQPAAKLLYAEITALASSKGYCWATNQYFADLYNVDISTVQAWIKSLKNQNFIEVEVEMNGIQRMRKIWITQEIKKMFTKPEKSGDVLEKIRSRGMKNQAHINKEINTYEEEREEAKAPTPTFFNFKRVKIELQKYEMLLKDFGETKISEMLERLDEYADLNPKRFKQYACHAAVIRKWVREDIEKNLQKRPENQRFPVNEARNSKIAKQLEERAKERKWMWILHAAPKKLEIESYAPGGSTYYSIDYSDSLFKEKIKAKLESCNIPKEQWESIFD